MSRRKQSRPRHVDDPDLDSPAITANPAVAVFPEDSMPEGEEDAVKLSDTVTDMKGIEGELDENHDQDLVNGDSRVCGKCREEFLDLEDFVAHKKECGKPVVLFFNSLEDQVDEEPSLTSSSVPKSSTLAEQQIHHLERMSQEGGSDGEQNFENIANSDEVDASAGADTFENQSDLDNGDDDYSKSMDDTLDEDNGSDKDEELSEDLKSSKGSDVPAYMKSLSNMLPSSMAANSNSNVLLEPLEATKAAVAQFAENNLPNDDPDVNRLQNALYTLQQQQLMQLQLIHQLQQQLVNGGLQNSQISAALLNGQLPLGSNLQGLNLNLPGVAGMQNKKEPSSKSSSLSNSPTPKEELVPSDAEKEKTPGVTVSPIQKPAADLKDNEDKKTSVLPPSSPSSALFSTPTSFKTAPSSSAMARSSSALDFSRSSTKTGSSETPGSAYMGTGDDPFFKHKCRLCHKVFGSDSALQIHIRSHTDRLPHPAFLHDTHSGLGATTPASELWTWEKPFQCNICGGRFSTRGNLKVHFQRHKQEFPNVEMNPNPVPEHLDKNPMPMLSNQFPAAALTPFANPAFLGMQNLMNGFMFPPPHLAPRPPMVGHGMMPKHSPQGERRPVSPVRESRPTERDIKKENPRDHPRSETPQHRHSPDRKDISKMPMTSSVASSIFSRTSPMAMPVTSIPLIGNYPIMTPLSSHNPFPQRSPIMTPSSMNNDPFRTTILPSNILDNDDNLEQFMEIDKSETSKLQQLVDNIEHKLTDPNQCVICHRVLSCKSALQMHYRIHTGERPFKCKICGRSFTTKGNLKTHMGVHRAKPPLRMMHQCPVCHKQFTNLLVLQQHIRSHTGMGSLPNLPGLNHLGQFSHHHFEDFQSSPLNMKRQFPEDFDRELDLSKKPRMDRDHEDHKVSEKMAEEMMQSVANGNDDDSDEDENEMDDEANKLAADDAKKGGLVRESSEGRSTPDSNDAPDTKPEITTPKSSASDDVVGFTSSIPRSSSPKYLQEDSNQSQEGSFNAYSTSLAALEERVRAIDTTMARNPLSQFHAAPFLLAPSHYTNGERAVSPRSDSGSDNGDKDGRKTGTPALSVSSEGSMGSNFMIGAMDGRSQDSNGKSTTCNVCFKTFACRSALDIHYRSHTKERPFKCDLCDRSFTTRGNMKQHLLTHKMDGQGSDSNDFENNNNNSCTPNQNDNDSEKSNDSTHFEESQQEAAKPSTESQVNGEKKEVSPSSQKPSASLTTPSSSSVTPNRNSFSSSDNQSQYVSKTPTVKHQCLVCQKGFSSASALQIHIRTHTGDKPFKCTVCGKAFTTKGNLKVHMGTHMWNNSPSRRGRRMSIEPPFMLAHKENPYLPHGFPPRPDFYPFQFPPFMNGLPTPPKSLSELTMMSGGSMSLKPEMPSPRSESRNKSEVSPVHDEKPKFAESGELDLSMKSTGSSGARSSEKTSPSSVDSNSSSGMVSPPHTSLGWGWKASCHLCSRTFPTPAALEHHVRNMHLVGDSLPKVVAS